ncbi:MAG TPA: glycosyltransferase family 4 protein [Xanthobacteraceae bacterium]|nr:glycosyltransferase family 4 protein [Xanthobacteraceae bacterium]
MRILHTEASKGWGGQEIRILDEAAGFIARGHDVHVAAPGDAPIIAAAAARGIPSHAIPVDRKSARSLRALARTISEFKPNIIVTHSSSDSWLAGAFHRLVHRRPAIVRLRHISAPVARGLQNRWLYGRVPKRVVTTGEAIRTMLIERLKLDPAHVVSIPTGTDLARFRPGDKNAARTALGLPADKPIIGIVATLRSWKGHRFLISAMNDPRLADARLVIVGDGPQDENLKQQIGALGLQERVLLAGRHDNVVPWLQAFDVFALPSTGNEGVPQALMQAMACGLPVVTTGAGAIPELAQDEETALIVPAESSKMLAAAIDRLLGDGELGRKLGRAARAKVEKSYSRDGMLDAMAEVFRKAAIARSR